MGFFNDFRNGLSSLCGEGKQFRNPSELAKFCDKAPAQIKKYLSDPMTNTKVMGEVLDKLGAKLVFPEKSAELSRDVCFVDAKVVPAGEYQISPPQVEDYLAVPLVEEVGAGAGIIPQGEFKSWFLVYKNQPAIMYRRDLIAVSIGTNSTSMVPTLNPKDIVLVDRGDKQVHSAGRMYLVMDPDGAGKIKRVSVDQKNNDTRIIFYSDNAAENPPEMYSLREDYDNNTDRVIVGRVVWAWSDVSNK